MQSYRRWGWEDQLAAEGAFFLVALAVIVIAVIITAIVAMIAELVRIFGERGFDGSQGARVLWYTLLGFLGICVVAGVMAAAVPGAMTAAIYLVAWSFLAFVLIAEGVDWYGRRRDPEKLDRMNELDTYLDFSTSSNGHGHGHGHGDLEDTSVAVPVTAR